MFDATKQGQRIEQLRNALKVEKLAFSEILGYTSVTNYDKLMRGDRNISNKVVFRLYEYRRDINIHWLLTGDGKMFLSSGDVTTTESDAMKDIKLELKSLNDKVALLLNETETGLKEDVRVLKQAANKRLSLIRD